MLGPAFFGPDDFGAVINEGTSLRETFLYFVQAKACKSHRDYF